MPGCEGGGRGVSQYIQSTFLADALYNSVSPAARLSTALVSSLRLGFRGYHVLHALIIFKKFHTPYKQPSPSLLPVQSSPSWTTVYVEDGQNVEDVQDVEFDQNGEDGQGVEDGQDIEDFQDVEDGHDVEDGQTGGDGQAGGNVQAGGDGSAWQGRL